MEPRINQKQPQLWAVAMLQDVHGYGQFRNEWPIFSLRLKTNRVF
jgi:hypothetical protein